MKKINLLVITIIVCVSSGCFIQPQPPSMEESNPVTSLGKTPHATSVNNIIPSVTSTVKPDNPLPTLTTPTETVTVIPTSSLETIDPDKYIGIEIPPLQNGFIEEFGARRISGEAPPTWVNYHVFVIRTGNERMLWLGVPILTTQGWPSGKLVISDIVVLPKISEDEEIVPFHCRRFGVNRWGIVAIIDKSGSDYSEFDYINDITRAWIIQPSSSKFIPITSDGVDCQMYPFIQRPILDAYTVGNESKTCP